MFSTGAKLCSQDPWCKGNRAAVSGTAVTWSNHRAFVQQNKTLIMALLSFWITWQWGFEHTNEMLPVICIYSLADLCHQAEGGLALALTALVKLQWSARGSRPAPVPTDTFPSAHSLFWVAAAAKKSIKQEDWFNLVWGSKASFTAALILLSPSCLSDCRLNAEPSKSHNVAALACAYILVCHFPVRSLAVGHHFPHHNAIAPNIAGRCEFAEGNRFGCRPSDGNLPSLE